MRQATFEELWRDSKYFRGFFVGKGKTFAEWKYLDMDIAKDFWEKRQPKIQWGFCSHGGCSSLVEVGDYCSRHCKPEKLPRWKWQKDGVLYRYTSHSLGSRAMTYKYKSWIRHQAEEVFGKLPYGYEIIQADGNYFNYSKKNLMLLSKISSMAVREGLLTLNDAHALDEEIDGFLEKRIHAGRKKLALFVTYEDVAREIKKPTATIRQAVFNGELDINSLSSVIGFVNKHQKTG